MHGVRRQLLINQAVAVGLPLRLVELPQEPAMDEYEKIMSTAVQTMIDDNFTCAAFGDIFLQDLRKYREDQLNKYGISTVFPLWHKDTTFLVEEFIRLGFRAIVVCVNTEYLDESFIGREIDQSFIADLPNNVDPCGENGEFHTFCFDGPVFSNPVEFTTGNRTYREYPSPNSSTAKDDASIGFWFLDLIPYEL